MKKIRLFNLVVAMLLLSVGVAAQEENKLRIADVTGMKSQSMDVPVYLDNTNPNIVAFQFDIATPAGVTISTSSAYCVIDNTRAVDHGISLRSLKADAGNRYRVIMLSPTNKPFKANKGKLVTLKTTISGTADLEEGETYPLAISGVVLSDSLGNNVMTAYENGSLRLGANPDFTVSNVSVTNGSTFNPKDTLSLSWQVNNVGAADAIGGFREQVNLVSATTGERVNLGTVYHKDYILTSGGSLSVEKRMAVPRIVGLDGEFNVEVKLIPNNDSGETSEYQSNNTALSANTCVMNKVLYITNIASVKETDAVSRTTYYVERSGSRAEAMTFPVNLTGGDARLSLNPTEVQMSKDNYSEYVRLNIAGNNTLDGDVEYTISIPATGGYAAVASAGLLVDDELPTLVMTSNKGNGENEDFIHEGDAFTLTISTQMAKAEDVTIKLSNNHTSRFNMPASVVLPAGETSVDVTVEAYQDVDVQEELADVEFKAASDDFVSGGCVLLLQDDDMPVLTFRLTPTTIGEGAGPRAVAASIVRDEEHKYSKVVIKVSTTNEDRLYSNTKTITMNPGVTEAQFSMATVDNALKDGDEDITVQAAIYISSCRCSALGTMGGVVTETVTLLDDDGPAVTLQARRSNILEGSTDNVFTVARNDDPVNDLVVGITTTGSDLVFPATVTIPAGQTSADFEVELQRNQVQGDSHTITFTAATDGYAKGSCWVMSTDQTLPDVYATNLVVANPSEVYATLESEVSVTVRNIGYDVLPAKTPIVLTCGGRNVSTTLYNDEAIPAGGEAVITGKLVLSDAAGTFKLSASVNTDRKVQELNYSDNTSEQLDLVVKPLIMATSVRTDKGSYATGETVHISGETTGKVYREAEVEIYLVNKSNRYTVTATTDERGHFSADWTPVGNVAGVFAVGACMPKEELETEFASIGIYGLRRTDNKFLSEEFEVSEVREGFIDITNHGSDVLTGITAVPVDMPDNITCEFDGLASLGAGETGRIIFRMTGLERSESYEEWQVMKAHITSAEGAVLDVPLRFAVYASRPQLKASVTTINTTMVPDTVRTYEFTIRNEGRNETGEITLDLGDIYWLSSATPAKMASLKTGEEATVVLQFKPYSSRSPLNSIHTGNIVLACANGGGVSINYRVECVSERTGTLVIDVWDEFTYNTEEAPHVEGATVNVLHPVTQKLLRQAVTGADGLATFDRLPEGNYIVKVTHPKHDSATMNVLVSPARETRQRAFIQYSAITIKMEYVKTEIEDVYDIVTTVTYETHVPKPVLLLDVPKKLILDSIQTPYVFYATMTNVGLVTAKQSTFEIPEEHNGYRFTPLIEGPWDIAAKQSVIIPVEITKIESAEGKSRITRPVFKGINNAIGCGLEALGHFFQECSNSGGVSGLSRNTSRVSMQTSHNCANAGGGGGGISSPPKEGKPQGGNPVDLADARGSGAGGGSGSAYVSCDPDLQCCGPDYIEDLLDMRGAGAKDALETAPSLLGECEKAPCTGGGGSGAKNRRILTASLGELVEVDWKAYDSLEIADQMKILRSSVEFLNGVYADSRMVKPVSSDMVEEVNHNISLPENQPSYLKAAYINMAPAYDYSYHLKLYVREILGNWEYPTCDFDETKLLIETIRKGVAATDEELQNMKPVALTDEQYEVVLERLRAGDVDYAILDSCVSRMNKDVMAAQRKGYADLDELVDVEATKAVEQLERGSSSMCATVKLQIAQRMTMTREAVRGTLTVDNGSASNAMRNIRLNLTVTDPYGNIATSRIMEIHTENKTGFTGDDHYESGWDLGAGETGVANILFIPTKYAAPTEPLQYTFAGTISFIDPFTGLEMTRDLEVERLTVNPSPNLEMVYFMQRDILGDDPLTDEIEPIVPSQFSVLINNKGYGDATNVKMVTNQPEIIENEKGLLVDFEILSSQLNGGDKTLAMGSSVATDFGTIPARSQVYAQWWMTSTLTGHFVDYDIKATHVTSFDNPDLTLLDSVHIHELIHQVKIPLANTTPPLIGFMANDREDTYDYPDLLYISDGTTRPIYEAERAEITRNSDTEYVLTVGSSEAGWNYGNIADPTAGRRNLLRIVRKSDGANIPLENFWLTDRTLVDKGEPVYENLLHFADSMSIMGETYTLTFEERPNIELQVASYSGVPTQVAFTREKVDTVTVAFNKDIDESTFTTDDISLMFEGEYCDLSTVKIVKVNSQTFKIAIDQLTELDGFYNLTVQTSTINDSEGFYGASGKLTGWVQVSDGMANLIMEVYPEDAGTVTPGSSKQIFDGVVPITATPNSGYKFLQWECEEEILSESPTYDFQMLGKKIVKAVFAPNLYNVTFNVDEEEGKVEGGGTGVYEYGKVMTLEAKPNNGYFFAGWLKDEVLVSADPELEVTVTGEATYTADFEPLELVMVELDENSVDNTSMFTDTYGKRYDITMNRKLSAWQWNPFCVPFDITEQQINKTWGYATSVIQLTNVVDGVLYFTSTYNIKAGVPYLVKPERTVTAPSLTYNNNIVVNDEPQVCDFGGIQYVGNYTPYEWNGVTDYYYGVKSGNIIKAKNTTASLKGMRAYFVVPQGQNVKIFIDGEFTGISEVFASDKEEDTRIYNLQGMYLGNDASILKPGIYIINGEKHVVR